MPVISLFSHEATTLPEAVSNNMSKIIEDAIQACFGKIAERLGDLGYPVTGDFDPNEVLTMEAAFENFVRTMALNNNDIAALNDF